MKTIIKNVTKKNFTQVIKYMEERDIKPDKITAAANNNGALMSLLFDDKTLELYLNDKAEYTGWNEQKKGSAYLIDASDFEV